MNTTLKSRRLRFGACLFLACLDGGSAASALAQRNPVHMSIEAHVAQADGVYVGTVSRIDSRRHVIDLRDHDKEGDDVATLTVEATETLKGTPRKRFQAFLYGDKTIDSFRTWSQKRTPLLWFVRQERANDKPATPSKQWSSFTLDPTASLTPLPMVGYFSMEFRLIRSPRQVLEIARRYAKHSSKTAVIHSLRYMPDLVHRLFPYNAGGELLVPIGPELEKVARRMILSPGSILPEERELKGISHEEYAAIKATDEGCLRRMGVEALAHFKSDANIALLKQHLDDPFLESAWDYERNVYSVRKMAFDALKKWGVPVAEPPLHPSEPRPLDKTAR